MRRRAIQHLTFLSIFLAVTLSTYAQDTNNDRNGVRRLSVSVINESGDHIKELVSENFKVYESKQIKDIVSFSSEVQPASIILLVDSSGSTKRTVFPSISRFIANLVAEGNNSNQYSIATFSEGRQLMLDFTSDTNKISECLQKLISTEPKGNTQLRDAIRFGFEKLGNAKFERKALIVLSDLGDNGSKSDFDDLVELAKKEDTIVYGVTVFNPNYVNSPMAMFDQTLIDKLVDLTGGRSLSIKSEDEMRLAATWIANNIRDRYLIGFVPTSTPTGAKPIWIKIDVKLDIPDADKQKKKLKVNTRTGYFALASNSN